jgi:hypothetical protein
VAHTLYWPSPGHLDAVDSKKCHWIFWCCCEEAEGAICAEQHQAGAERAWVSVLVLKTYPFWHLLGFHGAGMVMRQSKDYYPRAEFLRWHEGRCSRGLGGSCLDGPRQHSILPTNDP